MKKPLVIIGVIVAIAIGLSLWGRSMNDVSSLSNRDAAFACITHETISFHIHPTLRIVVNGEPQAIPANIGITASCMRALHTHDASGKIHIEFKEPRDFTLGDFFAVWDKPFSSSQILEYAADDTHKIRITLNGTEVDTYENTVLRDHDEIVIYYETSGVEVRI